MCSNVEYYELLHQNFLAFPTAFSIIVIRFVKVSKRTGNGISSVFLISFMVPSMPACGGR